MTLSASGSISISQVNTELGFAATAPISLGQASVRSLFEKATGPISLNDGHGKPYWNRLRYKPYPLAPADDGLTMTFPNNTNGIVMAQQTKLNASPTFWSFEVTVLTTVGPTCCIGVCDPTTTESALGGDTYQISKGVGLRPGGGISGWYSTNNILNIGLSGNATYFVSGDVIGVRIHADYIKFFRNGVTLIDNNNNSDIRGAYGEPNRGNLMNHVPAISCYEGGKFKFNFGASPWAFFVNGTNGEGWHV